MQKSNHATHKLLALVLALVLALSLVPAQVFAATSTVTPSDYSFDDSVDFSNYSSDGSPMGWGSGWIAGSVNKHYIDGKLGYCLEPYYTSDSDVDYDLADWGSTAEAKRNAVTRAMAFGAHSDADGDAAIVATQLVVWGAIQGYVDANGNKIAGMDNPFLEGVSAQAVKDAYADLTAAMRNNSTTPGGVTSNDVQIYNATQTPTDGRTAYQQIGVLEIPNGNVQITKSSGNTAITSGNSCYSLAGAEFGLYPSNADALANTNCIATRTTDSSGNTEVINGLAPATYYVWELTAPRGFARMREPLPVTVNAGETATVNVTDYPQSDPVGILLKKVDARTGGGATRG